MTQQQPRTKPSTRFVRHKQEEEHFRDLAACYQNLTDLCELFDRGQHFISSLIAVEIAKLVASESNNQSPVLLRIPRTQDLQFCSSPEPFILAPGHEIAGKYNLLVQETIRSMEAAHGVTMVRSAVPRCRRLRGQHLHRVAHFLTRPQSARVPDCEAKGVMIVEGKLILSESPTGGTAE